MTSPLRPGGHNDHHYREYPDVADRDTDDGRRAGSSGDPFARQSGRLPDGRGLLQAILTVSQQKEVVMASSAQDLVGLEAVSRDGDKIGPRV